MADSDREGDVLLIVGFNSAGFGLWSCAGPNFYSSVGVFYSRVPFYTLGSGFDPALLIYPCGCKFGLGTGSGEVISEEYVLEYGTDCLEMHTDAVQPGEHALVVDDLIATGGTLCAAIKLLERVGAEVVECACVIELPELKGRERLNDKPLYILVEAR